MKLRIGMLILEIITMCALCTLCVWVIMVAGILGQHGSDPNWHSRQLDVRGGMYQVDWLVDWMGERVTFNVSVATRGYVALGLARSSKMEGADIVIGGVSGDGNPYFGDYHAIGEQRPVLDASQDWELEGAGENETHTFLSFSRGFESCDGEDIGIGDDSLFMLWAFGERDWEEGEGDVGSVGGYHFEKRGSLIVYLRDPDMTPSVEEIEEDGIQVWRFREEFTIPGKRTTYWCNIKKFTVPNPNPGKYHIIGQRLTMNNVARTHMHHMILFRCLPPPPLSAKLIYEPFVNYPGNECYDVTKPIGILPTQFCYDAKLGQAIGGDLTYFFPNDFGIPIGETNGEEYFLLQAHYDNPGNRTDLRVEMDYEIFYTENLRENEGGVMTLGQNIPGSPSILVPPGERAHKIYGLCSGECTRKMFPPGGIRIVGGLLHAHNAARGLRLQHFRNGRELPWILKDDNYQFGFQPWRNLRREVRVMPGDLMSIRCIYATEERNTTVVGGYGTNQEMCQSIFFYYGRLEDYAVCRSEMVDEDYVEENLAGAGNFRWDQGRLENVAGSPGNLVGKTVSEISDSEWVNWGIEERGRLQRDHVVRRQVTICPSFREGAISLLTGVSPAPQFVRFPVEVEGYREENRCALV